MSFAIYRTKKLKSGGEIAGSLSHTYRTRETLNADQNRSHLNENSIRTYDQCFQSIKNAIPEKHRKDAVLCIEHLITASPDFFKNADQKTENDFFKKSLDFIKNKYGEKNVISYSIHRDETTPHLIVYVVPVDEKTGKLNAKKWLGGKAKLSQTQTEFANHVKEFGLERGLEGSKARHTTIKEFYAEIQKPTPVFKNYSFKPLDFNELPKIGLLETTSSYAKKLDSAYSEIKENTQKIFDKIINGLNNKHKENLGTYEVKLRDEIRKNEQLEIEVMRLNKHNSLYLKEIENQKIEKNLLVAGHKKQIEKIEREYSNFSYIKQHDNAFFMELDRHALQRKMQINAEKEQRQQRERLQQEQERRASVERSRLLENEQKIKEMQLQRAHENFVLDRKRERMEGTYCNKLRLKIEDSKNQYEIDAYNAVIKRRILPEPTNDFSAYDSIMKNIAGLNLKTDMHLLERCIATVKSRNEDNDSIYDFSIKERLYRSNDTSGEGSARVLPILENVMEQIDSKLLEQKHSDKDKIDKLVQLGDEVTKMYDRYFVEYIENNVLREHKSEHDTKVMYEKINAQNERSSDYTHEKQNKRDNDSSNDYTP